MEPCLKRQSQGTCSGRRSRMSSAARHSSTSCTSPSRSGTCIREPQRHCLGSLQAHQRPPLGHLQWVRIPEWQPHD